MTSSKTFATWVLACTVAACAFTAGVWLSMQHAGQPPGAVPDGVLWPDPPRIGEFHLIDHRGDPFTRHELRGQWTLLFFGFTHCPDVCPTSLDAMAKALTELSAGPAAGTRVQVVFVSVDPDRDGPEQLADYVGYFSPEFVGATGSEAELKSLASSVGALFMKVPTGPQEYTMDHSAGVFYIDPDGALLSILTPPHHAGAIAARFRAVHQFSAEKG